MTPKPLNALLWGTSVALSWVWGLGLFFSVQMALQFGWVGLLCFLIPNSLGLVLFGFLTNGIANRCGEARDFERHFFKTSHAMRWVILAYQVTALSLTFFAVFRYLLQPLGVYLPLAILLVLGAAMQLGEKFPISKIKWSHGIMFLVIIASACGLTYGIQHHGDASGWQIASGRESTWSTHFLGYFIPIVCGLVIGPWLDIQQWQRAIQMRREETNIFHGYLIGAVIFFGILFFHGMLALGVMAKLPDFTPKLSLDGLFHAKDLISDFLYGDGSTASFFFRWSYAAFILFCIVSTLDSGCVALKWYLKELTRKSENIILSLLPEEVLRAPIVPILLALAIAAVSVPLRFELEYFMAFYASFGVGYAVVFLFRTSYKPQFTNFTQTTLFSVATFSLGLFGIGYFNSFWYCMVAGAIVPLAHGFAVISSRVVVDDLQKALPQPDSSDKVPVGSVTGRAAELAITALEKAITRLDPKVGDKLKDVISKVEPQAAHALAAILSSINPGSIVAGGPSLLAIADREAEAAHARGHFEGKWFTITFMATYFDTNSVGNVYFGMYPIWVGKAREMYFKVAMPNWDIDSSPYYILTRSFEHKYKAEAKEFQLITVRIRVESFNRKFATLEHEIFNEQGGMLGSGKQVLMFVNSSDYKLVDMPNEVRLAFLPWT